MYTENIIERAESALRNPILSAQYATDIISDLVAELKAIHAKEDDLPRVRLWDHKLFTIVNESLVQNGTRPIDTVKTLLCESGLTKAVATMDWCDGRRWSGFVYLAGNHLNVIQHDEIKKLATWQEFAIRTVKDHSRNTVH